MPLAKLTISDTSGQASPLPDVEAQFNPTELTVTASASYAEVAVPGLRQPLLQFIRGETRVLTAELFFDGTDTQTKVVNKVTDPGTASSAPPPQGGPCQDVAALRAYTEIASELHAPPVCTVSWGQQLSFVGVITNLQEKYTVMAEDGQFLRARVSITVKSYVPARPQAQASATESPDRFKTRVVKEGDRLDLIAAQEYGDPTLWTVIARANGLARPRVLALGSVLQIPPL
jgi:hypothetical protein